MKHPRAEVKGRNWFGGAEHAVCVVGHGGHRMVGLAFATVLTLIVVPVLYAAFHGAPSPSPA